MPFDNENHQQKNHECLDFKLSDYLTLVDETGRLLRENKRGSISNSLAPILNRLQLNPQNWLSMVNSIESKFSYAIGDISNLTNFASDMGNCFVKGMSSSREFYQDLAA